MKNHADLKTATSTQASTDAHEITAFPPRDSRATETVEQTADILIRQMMLEETQEGIPAAAPAQPPKPAKSVAETPKPPKPPRRLFKLRKKKSADKVVASAAQQVAAPQPAVRKGPGILRRLARLLRLDRLLSYRPTRKHLIYAVLALIMVVRPWLLPCVLLLIFWAVVIAYLTLGPDRVTEIVATRWYKLRERRPALAERLRQRADKIALRIDAVLDRLPEKWTNGLYLPDLSEAALLGAQDDRPDPFDRLAKEIQHG